MAPSITPSVGQEPESDYLAAVQAARKAAGLKAVHGMSREEERKYWIGRIEDEPWERCQLRLDQKLSNRTIEELRELKALRESEGAAPDPLSPE